MRKQLLLTLLLVCGGISGTSLTMMAAPEPQQQSQAVVTINGTVLDENEEPVIGASIVQKSNRQNAAATDAFGHFKIRVAPGTQLVISYVGYKSVTMAAAADMTVYLQPTTEMLDEVVAIGYGTQKRANLTGAVTTVDVARVMDSRSVTDVTKALQGAVPGLTITNNDGSINGVPNIKLRGTGSLRSDVDTSPLIVVDGVIVEDLSVVNPEDIADISVLKDAASASIYGSRAAGGAILITTKTPNKKDRVSLKYSNNFGWSQATKLAEYPSVYDQVYALTEANLASGGEIGLFGMDPFVMMPLAQQWREEHGGKRSGYREMIPWKSDTEIGDYKVMPSGNGIYYADWDVAGIMFNNAAPSNSHNLSLEGASGKTTYRLSFGYSGRQDLNTFNPDKMRRYNANANIQTEIFSWLTAGARINFTEKDYIGTYNVRGDYQYMWRWGSYFGPYGWMRDAEGNQVDCRNDIAYRKEGGQIDDKFTQTRMTAYMDIKPYKNVTIHADFTYNVDYLTDTRAYMPVYCYNTWGDISQPGYDAVPVSWADARQRSNKSDSWMFNVYAQYAKTFANDYNLRIMAGAMADKRDRINLYAKRDELLDINLPALGLTTGGSNKTGYEITQTITPHATAGYFGRVNFDYKGIYLLEFNARYDGSSNFPVNHKWGFFPSGSIGYRFSEEKYFEPIKDIWSNGKLRASYGRVGNESIPASLTMSTIGIPQSSSWLTAGGAGTAYAPMPSLVSNSISWEKVTTLDVGLDFGFLDNQIYGSFDWFSKETSDMFAYGADVPASLGAASPLTNAGTIRANGYEIALNWNRSFGDANVYATFTFADAKTKIVKWKNTTGKYYSWTPTQADFTEGGYYGDIYGFETDRYFTKDDMNADGRPKQDQSALESGSFRYGVGDIKFKDLNGDGVINFGDPNMKDEDGNPIPVGTKRNHGDLKVIGNTQPRYEYSFRLGASWKGFDIDAFFQGVGKRDIWACSAFVTPLARGTDAIYSNQMSYNKQVIDMNTQKLTGEIIVDQSNRFPRLYPGCDGAGRLSGINNGRYNFYPQTRYLMNASYLRFKTLTFGYTLPYDISKKALMQKARIYFNVDNLCLLHNGMKNYPLDPEINVGTSTTVLSQSSIFAGNGYYGRTAPIMRTFSFGLQVTF